MTCDRDPPSPADEQRFERLPRERAILEALADPIRWATLAVLLEDESPRTGAALAGEVANRIGDGTDDEDPVSVERMRLELRHVHLPKLEAAALVACEDATGRIAPGEDADRVAALVTDRDEFPEALPVATDPCGRAALEVLATRDEPLPLEDLGRRLDAVGAVDRSLETVLIELHHRHLPALASRALVEYDAETRTVTPLVKADDLPVAER